VASLRRNIVANLAGKVWAAGLGLVFPPMYARLLGIESYGLVGVWASLNGILGVLDLGLSTTLNREIARHSTDAEEKSLREVRDVARTIEVIFWVVGFAAGGTVILLAPLIARHWVNAQHLSIGLVTGSLRLMGVVFALQWPAGVYNGGLLGLQKQITSNVIQAIFLAIRLAGAAFLLWKVQASIYMFFAWQALAMAAQTCTTGVALAKCLPGPWRQGAFRFSVVARNWRFSTGMFIISILAIILTQTDKVIASKVLALEQFGYYTLAWVVGGALGLLTSPIFMAVFPRLSQLVKQEDFAQLSRVYHAGSQLLSVLVLPAAVLLAVFSREVLFAWSGDLRLVAIASRVVTFVALGTALNGLMTLPYALQLAFGWTRLTVITNVIAVSTIVPLEYWLAKRYGMVGAAAGWVILNGGYVLFQLQAMHIRLLRGQQWRWYFMDVGLPLAGIVAVIVPIRLFIPPPGGRLAVCAYLIGIGMIAVIAAAVAVPDLRARGLSLVRQRWTVRGERAGRPGGEAW
jgi:O-antigen/teichoic acid export membrane protein